ncbi:MAG: hypothetical protein EXX96DRAFT_488047 [Benjaminiella poitrasii]|nr:MAG: hypothetical protein EXX96DRAFT_488047 [Benjaminiella poitrasii]
MFSDFVVAALDEITKTGKAKSTRILKSSWVRWVTEVANEMNITLNFTHDNWYIVENRLQQLTNETIITAAPVSLETMSSSQRISSSARSSKSSLGISLSEEDKRRVIASYNSLDVSNMWKLDSSGRYLENIMKTFCEESNYLQ